MKKLAAIGDRVRTKLNHPYAHFITVKINNPKQCALINSELLGENSDWEVVKNTHKSI